MSDRLLVKVLEDAPFKPPELRPAKPGDVGLDLAVCIKEDQMVISAGQIIDIPCGIAVKLPWGTWAGIKSRSSTFAKKKLLVIEGVIDEDYTGELKVFILNPNKYDVVIKRGERLAQLIVYPKVSFNVTYVDVLPKTERGDSGFGSTGGFVGDLV